MKNKILFAIKAPDGIPVDGFEEELPLDGWYDLAIYQISSGCYKLELETMLGFDDATVCHEYVQNLLKDVTDWAGKHGVHTDRVLDFYDVFTSGYNVNTDFESLDQLYATFRLLINGFEGNGLFLN